MMSRPPVPEEMSTKLASLYGLSAMPMQLKRWQALIPEPGSVPESAYGEARLFSAPGRTEIGGNHTDHNHGRVVAASVGLDTIALVYPLSDARIVIHSQGFGAVEVDPAGLLPVPGERGSSEALVRGVASWFSGNGGRVGGFAAWVSSLVPPGSGLSSSASFEVLIGTIFNHLYNENAFSPIDVAIAGQYAENEFFGKPCGLMDQIACAVGGVVGIDFENPRKPVVTRVYADTAAAGYTMAMVDTGGSHADLTHEYAAIPGEMKAVAAELGADVLRGIDRMQVTKKVALLRTKLGDRAVLRALHFMGENQRAGEQLRALGEGDFSLFLSLVRQSGASSAFRLQNLHASDPREQGMDLAIALTEDFLGTEGACRVHGGGFGGSIQTYVPTGRLEAYKGLMESVFGEGSVRVLSFRAEGALCL